MSYGKCGIDCDKCKFKADGTCKGCNEIRGKVFWGDCEWYACCTDKKHDHCGQCEEFPCARLVGALKGENAIDAIDNLRKF